MDVTSGTRWGALDLLRAETPGAIESVTSITGVALADALKRTLGRLLAREFEFPREGR
jgi:hypothetical protein